MANDNKIKVEVCFASVDQEVMLEVELLMGQTIHDAIKQSGILKQFPEIDLDKNKVGIFSKRLPLDTVVKTGDRVEIYRPLLIDPKTARRNREKSVKSKKN